MIGWSTLGMTCSLTIAEFLSPTTNTSSNIPPQHHLIAIMKAYWYDNIEVSSSCSPSPSHL